MKDNKTLQTLKLSHSLMKAWTQSSNFDLEVNRLRRQAQPEHELKRAIHLCLCVFRKKESLELILKKYSPKRPRGRVMHLLLPSLAAIIYMDKITPQGFADSAVTCAKKLLSKHDANFLNSFFHQVIDDLELNREERINDLNLGPEIEKQWAPEFTSDQISEFAHVLSKEAPLTCRFLKDTQHNLEPVPINQWQSKFKFYAIDNATKFFADFTQEQFYIQDPATSLSTTLLNPQKDEVVADLCAAPGGKTIMLSQLMHGQGELHAFDISEKRLETLRENLQQFPNVKVQCLDVRTLHGATQYDAILLDVPCSNTGVMRRKADARWSFSQHKLNELINVQKEILTNAAKILKVGGRLVYSTCSIERQENSQQVNDFLAIHTNFKLIESKQLFPSSEHDGAYAALLEKYSLVLKVSHTRFF